MENDAPAVPSIELPPTLTGEASKDRFLASICDNLVGPLLAVVIVATVGGDNILRGSIAVVAYLGYFFLSEALLGGTPGKLLFGLRVRRVSGEPASLWQVAVRTICRVIEVNPVVIGSLPACIFILATQKHQRLGDLLAGTVVVTKSSLQPA